MKDTGTKWDRIVRRFKNSWAGLTVLTLIALTAAISQVGDSAKKLIEWVRPIPAAEATIQSVSVEPLPQYRDLPTPAGMQTILPGGAILRFVARHDGKGDEGDKAISVYGLDVKVAYDPRAPCKFRLTADDIHGAGEGPLREFNVVVSGGEVEWVQRRERRDGPVARGRSSNLLDIEPPFPLVLRKGEDPENIIVNFVALDSGRYQVGLSIRYAYRGGLKTADIASVAFCKPQR